RSAMPDVPSFSSFPFTFGAQCEARSQHGDLASRILIRRGEDTWTYREFRDESVRLAHFLRRRLGAIDDARPGHVAMLLENHPELLFLYGGCGYAGLTLFGVNTGLRGETLSGVLNQSRARVLVVDQRLQGEIEKVRGSLALPAENVFFVRTERDGDLAG